MNSLVWYKNDLRIKVMTESETGMCKTSNEQNKKREFRIR